MHGSFWSFSLKVYAAPNVGDECMSLQDGYGIDVNLLLFAAFLGSKGGTLSEREVGEIVALVRDWHEQAIKPLRGARRSLKRMLESGSIKDPQAIAALRSKIKVDELEAERIEQVWLNDWANNRALQRTNSDPESAVRANIRLLQVACNAGDAPAPERLIAVTLAQRPL